MKPYLVIHLFLLTFFACGSPQGVEDSTEVTAQAAISTEEKIQDNIIPAKNTRATHQHWDGFYFYNIGMGSIIVIYNGKYYNFERKGFRSFYKDFEYDIAFELNEEGYIPIIRQYYLDRKEQLNSKEKVLFDTQPIEEDGKTTGLKCRGYKYQHIPDFGAYIQAISVHKADVIKEIKENSNYQDDAMIETALKDPAFVEKSKMTEAPLRKETLPFWQLVVNIIEAT